MEYVSLSARLLRLLGAHGPQGFDDLFRRLDPPVWRERVDGELNRLVEQKWVKRLPDGRFVSTDVRYRPQTDRMVSFYTRVWKSAREQVA